ncbi:hypothetical protein Athai_01410 [Actinocatenispora thailandica]|uniref:Uncharacterized protein n=1 Tax=Actinocatenispora thailandica TaxID=227318 RepID=A0A7R7DJ67_9ACTN|nr:hypothetical protein [Actinocatenispora thailandica]BCJ32638.1 hypothetical protein Athai_01410 [Actinocatenispora thailandica]
MIAGPARYGTQQPDWRPASLPPDRLAGLAEVVTDLLATVDRALRRYGVPPQHPVVADLREFRALPGALARSIVDTDPEPVWQRSVELARHRTAVLAAAEPVLADGDDLRWSGAGQRAYQTVWASVSAALGAELPAQLLDTAEHGARLARWYGELRAALVSFFLRYGNSPAAVTLRGGPAATEPGSADELDRAPAGAAAAADLAAACFAALRPVLAAGRELHPATTSARPALPTARTPDHDTGTDSGAFHAGHD